MQPIRDTRPIRDKPFQAQMARTISKYLSETSCPVQLSHKIHTATPTSQQYWVVIDWLVHEIDPYYPDPKPGQGNFSVGPNEFINVLKQFMYPFADGIDKKSLSTVGGMHSWPAMLAALHYLVSLCMVG
jgi:kinetochore protein NDC80